MPDPLQGRIYRRIQWGILLLLFFAITIHILDRQVLSVGRMRPRSANARNPPR
ncbi:MAG TPA: hypothetical protein VKB88_25420 [Bryobacteraceae bacterium]|nr:hypothetical protein [Bryobacteraceae bacterium]